MRSRAASLAHDFVVIGLVFFCCLVAESSWRAGLQDCRAEQGGRGESEREKVKADRPRSGTEKAIVDINMTF